MIKKILFSPIGGSDPVNALYDGAWIHCCRHFQPDITVVYLSAQMLPRETEKHFFSGTLEKLNQWLGKEILFETEPRPELENPQDFEAFYSDFEGILTKYHLQYPDAEILVNVSSGTPAMKGCLIHLYHMLPFSLKLIQVFGPHDEMGLENGKRYTVSDDYDVEDGWKNDFDNEEGAANRCHVLKDQQQAIRLKVMQLKTLIRHNEFSAALTLAEDDDLKGCLPDKLITLLRGAVSRMQMDLYSASLSFGGVDYEDGKIIRSHYRELLFQGAELMLTMKVDLERDDIASCLRKLTPVLYTLIIGCIGKNGIDIASVMDETQMYLDRIKFSEKYPDQYSALSTRLFSDKWHPDTAKTDSGTLLVILKGIANANDAALLNIDCLRTIEKNIRNEIAHKPIKMTEDVFRRAAACGTDEMIARIQETFTILNPSLFASTYWKSYDRMKELILANVAIL